MHPQEDSNENSNLESSSHAINPANYKLFHQLFEADKRRLYAYILAFVSDKTTADDIFQETCLVLWQKFNTFEVGTSFSKWANTIAYYKIINFRSKQNKYQLGLDDDFLLEFSDNLAIIESRATKQEKKWRHLEHCRSQLSSSMQTVYHGFYVENSTAQHVADNTGRSIYAIRKALGKLRKKLIDCIDNKVKEN
ncbi:sigma-70 family RNA polymerase sigma factor [Catenovulum agarivorans]|uniref:sigma-70 family RNA polymerase sigma factor n=1 Tax=Catenovulum agarivorans TaxID=1172192 RepID=UPI0003110CE6|nr:sigma-70 family RNA polymerase sigma factor [Catenovulum agarivorans]